MRRFFIFTTGGVAAIVFIIAPLGASAYTFTNYLDYGSSGSDVSALQQTLKDQGYFSYSTITDWFGPITQEAVQKFQCALNIVCDGSPETTGYGRVGPATLSALNNLDATTTAQTTTTTSYTFTRDLGWGMQGEDVRELQKFLNANGFPVGETSAGSLGNETDWFGSATQAALANFQAANGIVPAVGFFGPLTRAKIAELSTTIEPSAPSVSVPDHPQSLKVEESRSYRIVLSWDAVDGATLYNIKRKGEDENDYSVIGTATTTTFTDTHVSSRTFYSYIVTASNAGGESSPSSVIAALARSPGGGGGGSPTPDPVDTTAPSIPTSLAVSAGDATSTLTWIDPSDSDLASVKIYRGTTSGSLSLLVTVSAGTQTYSDTALHNDITYYYAVSAIDSNSNESPQSSEQSAAPTGVYDIYVDSVDGSDSNDGTSDFVAIQTLSKAQTLATAEGDGVKIGLKKGSHWREMLDLHTLNNVTLAAYGSAASLPIVDSSDILSSWTKTGGYTNVYQATTTKGAGPDPVNYAAWEDNVDLLKKTSIAQVDAAAGSAYIDASGADQIIYVHPTDSGNPSGNGKVYEAAARLSGVDLSGIGSTATHVSGNSVSGIFFRRNLANNGSLVIGTDSTISNVIAYQGHYHNLLIGDGDVSDFIVFDKHNVVGGAMLVAYSNSASTKQLSVDRFYAVGVPLSPSSYDTADGFYTHQDGGGKFSSVDFTQFAVLNTSGSLSFANTDKVTLTGGYLYNTDAFRVPLSTSTINMLQVRGKYSTTAKWQDDNLNISNMASYNGPTITRVSTSTIEYSALIASSSPIMTGGASENLTFNNNIVLGNGGGSPILWTKKSDYQGDYNIFYYPVDARTIYIIGTDDLGSNTNYFTLSSWQAAVPGQDTHSVYLTTAQFNDFWLTPDGPSVGDFRIKPGAEVTWADGTVSTTFTDGTALTEAGPQSYWDWDARASASGTPASWPNIPDTLSESEEYILDPAAWSF